MSSASQGLQTWATAGAIAAGVASGTHSAERVVAGALERIATLNPTLNAFTAVTRDRALAKARAIDADGRNGRVAGPLAGVPFAVKNLFDVAGLTTVAGSRINRNYPPASADATLIARLEAQGGVLVGALNMGEYAYDFTGENAHDGASRNPHDLDRMTGGSSGGSGGAVAGGLVPIALGSDTNGSIRVPASLCGIFGLKPTYGRLSRAGTFPFVSSLDHLGPLARCVADLALSYDAMQGPDPADPVCTTRQAEPTAHAIARGIEGVRLAVAGDYFRRGAHRESLEAVERVARALGVTREVVLPKAANARAAAYIITATEAAALHLDRIRRVPGDFDPDVRDRLIAGTMIPATFVAKAQKLRRWYRTAILELFRDVDVIIAPATPCSAPTLGQKTIVLDGEELPLRPNLGIFTQPISFIGLPVVAVPIPVEPLPVAVQVIAAPWREDIALRVAYVLESMGVAVAPRPNLSCPDL